MGSISELLTLGGTIGMVSAFLFVFMFLLVLPIACIIDCASSQIESGAKTFIIIVLILTWGLVSFIYGLFFAKARWLRRLTLISFVAWLLTFAISAWSLYTGVKMNAEELREREAIELEQFRQLGSSYAPEVILSSEVKPFIAMHKVPVNKFTSVVSLVPYNLDGPNLDEATTIDSKIIDVARDTSNSRYYAITNHDVGTVSESSGQLVKFDLEDLFSDFSWPKGIAYDSTSDRVIVMTSHVYNYFYAYSVKDAEWTQLGQRNRGLSLYGLAFADDRNRLFSIVIRHDAKFVSKLAQFNLSGALVGELSLEPPIPTASDSFEKSFQIGYSSGKIMLILPDAIDSRINVFAVDPDSGKVMVSDSFAKGRAGSSMAQ